jgi:RNA polymerase sigma-70 factor, ECF subfamily
VIDPAVSPQQSEVSAVTAEATAVPDGFSAVYREECGPVVNFLRRLGVRPEDLEDLTHDVFITALRRRDTYDPTRPVRPWLFGIAVRLAADFKRLVRHSRELPFDPAAQAADSSPIADEVAALNQDRQLVLAALARIEPARRGVFVMHDIEGVAVPEIAHNLGIPLGTAQSRLRQARIDFADAVSSLRQGGGR